MPNDRGFKYCLNVFDWLDTDCRNHFIYIYSDHLNTGLLSPFKNQTCLVPEWSILAGTGHPDTGPFEKWTVFE